MSEPNAIFFPCRPVSHPVHVLPIAPGRPPPYVFISICDWPASVQVAGASISRSSGEQNGWNGSFISFGRCWHAVMLENRVTALDRRRRPGQGSRRRRRSDGGGTSGSDRWVPLDSGGCQGRWWRGAGDGPGSRRRVAAGQRCFRASYARDEVPSILVERNVAEGPAGIDGEELLNIYWALTRLSLRHCCARRRNFNGNAIVRRCPDLFSTWWPQGECSCCWCFKIRCFFSCSMSTSDLKGFIYWKCRKTETSNLSRDTNEATWGSRGRFGEGGRCCTGSTGCGQWGLWWGSRVCATHGVLPSCTWEWEAVLIPTNKT